MPFKKYKANHDGRGPMEDLYSRATGGRGLFGRLGMREERELTDQLIADVSSNDEFAGLAGLTEAGRGPLTREQHAEFRSSLTQAALDSRVFNAGFDEYVRNSARARAQSVSKEDGLMLDNFDAIANHARRLAASGNGAKAQEVLGTVLQNFGAYVARNEEQRLEVDSAKEAGRDKIRDELQGEINTRLLAPMIEDEANYRSILAQLERGQGAEAAPNALTSAVLEYAGAQLRGSDDGNWSFSIGPLGLSDAAVPTMTFSQLRNQLNAAFRGRNEFMRAQLGRYGAEAQKRGFGINGTNVDDLLFPLANEAFPRREIEFAAPKADPARIQSGAEGISSTVGNALSGAGRGFFPNLVGGATNALEFLFGPDEAEDGRLPVNGDTHKTGGRF